MDKIKSDGMRGLIKGINGNGKGIIIKMDNMGVICMYWTCCIVIF